MSYFSENYEHLKLPLGEDGFRKAQWGALLSIGAHFSVRSDAAVISMPTGSGKTAVLMAAAYLLCANRVLVLTSTRLVRGQIAEDFRTLRTLRHIGALSPKIAAPKVIEVTTLLSSPGDWDGVLDGFDVVVARPTTVSPSVTGIVPPADAFDLVLVDEAHHLAADTWMSTIGAFSKARRVYFTATPFRRDQLEIPGHFAYVYPLSQAFNDKIYGKIEFHPVGAPEEEESDIAIAKRAEELFRQDRDAGLKHAIVVRTDSKERVKSLAKLYDDNTGLRLETVFSDVSFRRIKQTITKLQKGDLDGVICVNMLGEGFDFPRLKLAALHTPFKSLAATLQFIGRFARTNDPEIGTAKFVAAPSTIEFERRQLYTEGAVWNRLIADITEARIEREKVVREVLETFCPVSSELVSDPDAEDVSFYSLKPYLHVKILRLQGDAFQLEKEIKLAEPRSVVQHKVSTAHNAVIVITREATKPRWTAVRRFESINHELVVLYHDPIARLLFICSSRRDQSVYDALLHAYGLRDARQLPLYQLHRVRSELQDCVFFNIGMQARIRSSQLASYQILVGTSVQTALKRTDGRFYHSGHAFMGGRDQHGRRTTLGLSSASKVWSNQSAQIPDLLAWCKSLAERIEVGTIPMTGSAFDTLGIPDAISEFPSPPIAMDWDHSMIDNFATLVSGGSEYSVLGCDFDIVDSGRDTIQARLVGEAIEVLFTYHLAADWYDVHGDPEVFVRMDQTDTPIANYLNAVGVVTYLADMSSVVKGQRLAPPDQPIAPIAVEQITSLPWRDHSVEIKREYWPPVRPNNAALSIHEFLEQELVRGNNDLVFYDHDSGEMADFVEMTECDTHLLISFYHCKAAAGAPRRQVEDAYEVIGQAVKGVKWADIQVVRHQMETRGNRNGATRFRKGDSNRLQGLMAAAARKRVEFEMVIVQPAFLFPMSLNQLELLGGADTHLRANGFLPLRVIGYGETE